MYLEKTLATLPSYNSLTCPANPSDFSLKIKSDNNVQGVHYDLLGP